jgi:uncharacterized protein YdeI (YjbR/CyaY-like superfamily)
MKKLPVFGPVAAADGPSTDVRFFATVSEFRAWLSEHHEAAAELWVGFYRKDSGRPSITWPEAVDEALCFGWIDSVRRRIDDQSYANRFTPRRKGSTWSKVNVERVRELTERGLMHPAGLRAFEARHEARTGVYSYEAAPGGVEAVVEERLRANEAAWNFFSAQPPWYQRAASHWVMSAKREETRARRLATLIQDSANRRRVRALTPPAERA